jgi:hypothetical protein
VGIEGEFEVLLYVLDGLMNPVSGLVFHVRFLPGCSLVGLRTFSFSNLQKEKVP